MASLIEESLDRVDWNYVIKELQALGFDGEELYEEICKSHVVTEADAEKIETILDIF